MVEFREDAKEQKQLNKKHANRLKVNTTESTWPEMPVHFSKEVAKAYQERREHLYRIISKCSY